MPIPTSSMYQNVANQSQNPRRQQARHLWAEFRMYAMKARQGMHDRRNMALQDAHREWLSRPGRSTQEREQQRIQINKLHEKQYYLEMREEWQRMLHSNGLRHEDWGEVTAQEMAVIRQILGPDDIEDEEEEGNSSSSGGHGAEIHNLQPPPPPRPAPTPAPTLPHDFHIPINVAAQPLSQSMSHQSQASFSSHSSISSNNNHSHSYAAPSLASRSQNTSSASYAFVDPRNFTEDERDDFAANPFLGRRGAGFPLGSEDEGSRNIPAPNYKSWANGGGSQQQTSGFSTRPHSSNPSSLSSSPVDAPGSRFHHPLSSSLSSSSHFPPHIPSSLSKPASTPINDDADRIFTAPMGGISSSSSAAAANKSKSKVRTGYIGPQLTPNESENEADADFGTMSKADQVAAFERFKREARAQKIREFHEEAARLDIEVAERISGRSDKTWVAQMIAQHEQDMLSLRMKKEEERKILVEDERARMTTEIKKGRGKGLTAGTSTTTTTTKKSGWGTPSATAVRSSTKGNTAKPSSSTPTVTSSAFSAANKTPVAPTHKPKAAAAQPPTMKKDQMDLDELQSVLQTAPDMDLDTAFQITQLLQSGGNVDFDHGPEHDQDWNTPQLRHKPSGNFASASANAQGPRKRTDSVSVLDESRFGTISAKGKQRRGTITPSTVAASANNNNDTPHSNGFWKPQPQPSSPEQNEDPFVGIFSSGAQPPLRTSASRAAMHQADDNDDWAGWGSLKPTGMAKANGGGKTTTASSASNSASASAWSTAKKPAQNNPTSSPTVAPVSGWGASVKKTFGFGTGGWGEQGEEEMEEEQSHPSLFGGQAGQKKQSSLLSDMVTKGKNAVAGAVGAALGPANSPPSPIPNIPSQIRKKGAQVNAPPTPPPPTPPATAPTAGKKTTKRARPTTTRKGSLSQPSQEEESQESPQPTTPRAAAASTKYTSTFGSPNPSSGFTFGSPSSRNAMSSSSGGGLWEDVMSTTPRQSGLSHGVGGHGTGAGVPGHVRKPSGLHNQVWNAGGEEVDNQAKAKEEEWEEEYGGEQEEEQEEELEPGEDDWNMPGSLRTPGTFGSGNKGGKSSAPSAKVTQKKTAAPTASVRGGWGSSPASATTKSTSTTTTTNTNSKKKGSSAAKRAVTMEEIPDESDQAWNRSPSNVLASDSRVIMEPKPSKPSMFDDIIQFGEGGTSPEDTRHKPLSAKRRNQRFVNVNQQQQQQQQQEEEEEEEQEEEQEEQEDYGPSWFQKAAMQLKQGTEEGNKLFGAASDTTPAAPATKGANVSPRGTHASGNKSSAWGAAPSNAAGSFTDSSPLAGSGPPKKRTFSALDDNTNTPKHSAWGSGLSSNPQIGAEFGAAKAANTKAKPTTGTSSVFGFGWGASENHDQENDPWGSNTQPEEQWEEVKTEEDLEREKILLDSRKRLQNLFGDSTSSSAKPPPKAAVGGAAARAKALKEEEERQRQEQEAREEEERAAQEREEREAQEREAQEKAAKEKEAKEKEALAAKTAGAKAAAAGAKKGKKKR